MSDESCPSCGYAARNGHEPNCLWGYTARAPRQPTLAEAREARERAIAEVTDGADEAWKAEAYAVIQGMARQMYRFTADDVWARVEKPREPRALIGVLRAAAREGLIDQTDEYAPSRLRHASPLRVWKSLVFQGVGVT